MHCLYCRQKIGAVRKLWDSKFCCSDHRLSFGTHSSRVLRDKEDVFAYHERWCDDRVEPRKQKDHRHRAVAVFGVVILILACGAFFAPSYAPHEAISFSLDEKRGSHQGYFGSTMNKIFAGTQVLRAQDNFQSGFQSWKELRSGTEWAYESGHVRPGKLRIWAPSERLSNYDFEFVGQIERKSLAYAFRATNARNYYATKLMLGGSAQSELVRYLVLDGRVQDRLQLPIPISLERGTDYRVRLSVRGAEFLTSVNGQVVSSWRDGRLSRGGVGFFSEDGEVSLLKWVSLSERDSMVGRVLSHFSLIVLPVGLPEAGLIE